MNKTALNKVHRSLGGNMVEFAGYDMPLYYTSIVEEHKTVRTGAGVFDVSHMGDLWIEGKDAVDLLQATQTNDFKTIEKGEMRYTHCLNEQGHIKDDMICGRFPDERYLVVPNAATKDMILGWLKKVVKDRNFDVEIKDETDELTCLALQGPKAPDIMEEMVPEVKDIEFFHFIEKDLGDIGTAIISSTGYTGEPGFEIIVGNEGAEALWDRLMRTGEDSGIKPIGLGARDTLRMEKGFLLSGQDFNEHGEEHTSLEANCEWVVEWDHDFIGKDKMINQKERGVEKILTGIVMDERGVPRNGYPILDKDGDPIGHITSGTMSPVLKKGIGLGYIKPGLNTNEAEVQVEIRGRKLKAHVAKPPLV